MHIRDLIPLSIECLCMNRRAYFHCIYFPVEKCMFACARGDNWDRRLIVHITERNIVVRVTIIIVFVVKRTGRREDVVSRVAVV